MKNPGDSPRKPRRLFAKGANLILVEISSVSKEVSQRSQRGTVRSTLSQEHVFHVQPSCVESSPSQYKQTSRNMERVLIQGPAHRTRDTEKRGKAARCVRERRSAISLSGCEWRWKGQPPLSDRPLLPPHRRRPVSETFMKQHRALSNWTNIVKKKNRQKTSNKVLRAVVANCDDTHRVEHVPEPNIPVTSER